MGVSTLVVMVVLAGGNGFSAQVLPKDQCEKAKKIIEHSIVGGAGDLSDVGCYPLEDADEIAKNSKDFLAHRFDKINELKKKLAKLRGKQ